LSGATSKLIANDALDLYLRITENISPDSSYDALSIYARAELLTYQKQYKRAIQTMDTLISLFPNDPIIDDAYFQKAMIAKDLKEYSKADSLLAQTFEYNRFGSLADNALIERARLFDYVFEEKQRAQTLYQQIILEYQGSLFTVEARMRYRALQNKPEQ
jgi:tetratricopeptide (TPR) repeat protein